ncbi:glycosyltransferase family 2 protein [Halorubellus sp. PRR65]|uniref:glycosyltransferase n=1 Tax=Halorubellus sp. PRR65 TaxID=3098148 RepID=UPI002B25F7F6|nr:glycosyltransferase family 2 protein [Halorubellus sp. PRR65]
MTDAIHTERTTTAPENLVSEGETPTLSVVIIARNEEDRIRGCIESVFTAADGVDPFEVILVDSASTDDTVDLARDYPITVLRIPEELTSVGAGRFVGNRVARGDLVLQADGDMALTDEWLGRALSYLRSHDVAGVEGWLNECDATAPMAVDAIAGVALYDRDALESIGGFAPYLQSYEDIEVGFRLTTAGHRLVRLPIVSANHPLDDPLAEPFRRWRAGYYHGVGQAIRYGARNPRVLAKLVARQRYKFALLAWLAVGALSILSPVAVVAWALASAFAFAIVAKRLGVRRAIQFVLTKSLATVGATRGLLAPVPPAETYPLSAIEVVDDGRLPEGYARSKLD